MTTKKGAERKIMTTKKRETLSIKIIDDNFRARAIKIIEGLPLQPVFEVIVKEYKVNRTLEQNALLWKWQGYIGEDLGYTKDEVHLEMKRKYLLGIMLAHKNDYPQVAAAWAKLTAAITEQDVNDQLSGILSTTSLKVKHMSEYLKSVYLDAQNLNIILPDPRDQGRGNF